MFKDLTRVRFLAGTDFSLTYHGQPTSGNSYVLSSGYREVRSWGVRPASPSFSAEVRKRRAVPPRDHTSLWQHQILLNTAHGVSCLCVEARLHKDVCIISALDRELVPPPPSPHSSNGVVICASTTLGAPPCLCR
jgi:hypothetical protein